MSVLPWITIPAYAQPGQAHAFANRERELASLYKALVEAGNAVRRGRTDVRQKHVVSGYMGVGKSALILQALAMIRGEGGGDRGFKITVPSDLPMPVDPQRWIILRISGKQYPDIEALTDAVRRIVSDEESADSAPDEPMMDLLRDIAERAQQEAPAALQLTLLHRLLRTREQKVYTQVRAALRTLALTIEYVKRWYGGLQTDKLERSDQHDSSRDAEARIEAQLKAATNPPGTKEAQAALKLAAGTIRKVADSAKLSSHVERSWRINSDLIVEMLNEFFHATNQARLPTLLVLDDFDEFTSAVGPSHEARSRVLQLILGSFGRLTPTCLVMGLRQEYMHEDILRVFQRTHVPPMTRRCAALAIDAWAEVQQPALAPSEVEYLKQLGGRLLAPFDEDAQVVVPSRFLPFVVWMANMGQRAEGTAEENQKVLLRYLSDRFLPEGVRALQRVAEVMPDDDLARCLSAAPVDSTVYALTDGERRALEQEGLLRPAMAGDAEDRRIVIDPLAAYLRATQRR